MINVVIQNQGKMIKVLVIEDEKNIRENILELLQAENIQGIGASNGKIGVKLAREHKPDLIICDLMMPELDGYGVLTELKNDPKTATIPLIFLTAKETKDDIRKGMNLGADDYLTKPCTPEELLTAIATRLERNKIYIQQYEVERDRAKKLQKRVQELQMVTNTAEELLQKISLELRAPASNIAMALQMLKIAPSDEARERYLKILREENERQIAFLNQLSKLKELLTPENVNLLLLLTQKKN